MNRKVTAGSNQLDIHNVESCYEASAAVLDEFIHNKNNGAASEGNKDKKGKKGKKVYKAKKAEAGNETARIARMVADAGNFSRIPWKSGAILHLIAISCLKRPFLISERVFSGLAGTAARAKLGCTAFESLPAWTGKPDRPRKRGAKAELADVFSRPEVFKIAEAITYGTNKNVIYCENNLLWGENPAMLKFAWPPGLKQANVRNVWKS
ncbi:MAG: hypothetical protein LBU32_07240 [Clostridiales bacterium]|nr:hypothetical protein [Clostridiales bacterium]